MTNERTSDAIRAVVLLAQAAGEDYDRSRAQLDALEREAAHTPETEALRKECERRVRVLEPLAALLDSGRGRDFLRALRVALDQTRRAEHAPDDLDA